MRAASAAAFEERAAALGPEEVDRVELVGEGGAQVLDDGEHPFEVRLRARHEVAGQGVESRARRAEGAGPSRILGEGEGDVSRWQAAARDQFAGLGGAQLVRKG